MFGDKDEDQARNTAAQAEVDRLDALPLARLAVEVMTRGFGPEGPGGPGKPGTVEDVSGGTVERVDVNEIARQFAPPDDAELWRRLGYIVAEGLQALENAALVRVIWNGGKAHYMATRCGRAAAARNRLDQVLAGDDL